MGIEVYLAFILNVASVEAIWDILIYDYVILGR